MTHDTAGPFELHLREAIALNRDRAPRYAALSRGISRRISWSLITAERLLLPLARRYDRLDVPYREAGVSLIAPLFVPMSGAPSFLALHPPAPGDRAHQPVRPCAVARRVRAAYRAGSFAAADDALGIELARLTRAPGFDCLVRHVLESARRLARFAPVHDARARELGLPSSRPHTDRLLRLHLGSLWSCALLDRWARPLQLRGIAILARDLPPVPAD